MSWYENTVNNHSPSLPDLSRDIISPFHITLAHAELIVLSNAWVTTYQVLYSRYKSTLSRDKSARAYSTEASISNIRHPPERVSSPRTLSSQVKNINLILSHSLHCLPWKAADFCGATSSPCQWQYSGSVWSLSALPCQTLLFKSGKRAWASASR
jgi:hypothetical protein